MPKPMW